MTSGGSVEPFRSDFDGISPGSQGESDAVRRACDCFVKQGYALLDNVLAADRIDALRRDLETQYADYLMDRELEDSLLVGERRYMFSLRLRGRFAEPAIFANPFVMAVVERLLQGDVALEAFGLINSLQGAAAQPPHRDGPPLFNSDISALLPPHALTCALPLVDMDDSHGTTAIWPGSHRWKEFDPSRIPLVPQVPVGSCLLWDFRLFHSGTANKSEIGRPMICSTFARRWYEDPVNFIKGTLPRLIIEPEFLSSLSPETRRLFVGRR